MKFAVIGALVAALLAPAPFAAKASAQPAAVAGVQAAQPRRHPLASVPQRKALALHFYERTGWKRADIGSHLSGIDFAKPVMVVRLKPGAKVMQFRFPDRPMGNYFTPVGSNPATLGINPAGRQAILLRVHSNAQVLRSVASDTSDRKDLPVWSRGHGGGTQYFAVSTQPFGK